jgi:hypothetical protein
MHGVPGAHACAPVQELPPLWVRRVWRIRVHHDLQRIKRLVATGVCIIAPYDRASHERRTLGSCRHVMRTSVQSPCAPMILTSGSSSVCIQGKLTIC